MKKILCFALSAFLGLPLNALAKPDQFSVAAANSEINYEVSYMQYNTSKGRFNDFAGVIVWDAEKPETSSVNITVQAKSVATGYPNIDRMLQGADLFNVAKYPIMSFKSTSVKAKNTNALTITGDLTLCGVTKSISFDVQLLGVKELGDGKAKAGFQGGFTVSRRYFSIGVHSNVNNTLGDDVSVKVHLEGDRVAN